MPTVTEVTTFEKDPNAVLDYSHDYTAWLGEDLITGYTVAVAGGPDVDASPLVVDSHTIEADKKVILWLSGGTLRQTYFVTVHITTAGLRQDDRTTRFIIVNR